MIWIVFPVAVVGGILTALIFESKGKSAGAGFALGFFVPIVGVVFGLAMSPTAGKADADALANGEGKKCPQCAEIVKRDARICRFCQHVFGEETPASVVAGPNEKECPNCHSLVFHTAKRCAFCKTQFTAT